jgi:glycosyltransferase involved in cell wall biosynthesis
MKRVSVIIYAYNVADILGEYMHQLCSVRFMGDLDKEIIIINDCSGDHTLSVILTYIDSHPDSKIHLINNETKSGKGSSLQKAIQQATGDIFILKEVERGYDFEEMNLLLQPVLDGFADVVYGSRYVSGNPHRKSHFAKNISDKIFTFFSNVMTNLNLSDVTTGYKLITRNICEKITVFESRAGFDMEFIAKVARVPSVRIYEIGISYYGGDYKRSMKQKLELFFSLCKYNLF